eukprot:7551725-Alexandrium_andersonii.AAC.1
MSASLVGSEMCIRDRQALKAPLRFPWLWCRNARPMGMGRATHSPERLVQDPSARTCLPAGAETTGQNALAGA